MKMCSRMNPTIEAGITYYVVDTSLPGKLKLGRKTYEKYSRFE